MTNELNLRRSHSEIRRIGSSGYIVSESLGDAAKNQVETHQRANKLRNDTTDFTIGKIPDALLLAFTTCDVHVYRICLSCG